MKKKAGKAKASRSMKDLPSKAVNAKAARRVRGGFSTAEHGATTKTSAPTETVTFEYGGLSIQYSQQPE